MRRISKRNLSPRFSGNDMSFCISVRSSVFQTSSKVCIYRSFGFFFQFFQNKSHILRHIFSLFLPKESRAYISLFNCRLFFFRLTTRELASKMCQREGIENIFDILLLLVSLFLSSLSHTLYLSIYLAQCSVSLILYS